MPEKYFTVIFFLASFDSRFFEKILYYIKVVTYNHKCSKKCLGDE
jgi:hypothetical protein